MKYSVFVNGRLERRNRLEEIKPGKLVRKIPMKKMVVDNRHRLFAYNFLDKKLFFIYIGSYFINK